MGAYLVHPLLPPLTAQSHLDRLVHQAGDTTMPCISLAALRMPAAISDAIVSLFLTCRLFPVS